MMQVAVKTLKGVKFTANAVETSAIAEVKASIVSICFHSYFLTRDSADGG